MDFFTFKTFISTEVLIIFYYLGAIVIPIGIWLSLAWLLHRYGIFNISYEKGKEIVWKSLNTKQKTNVVVFFITSLLFMELFWRMFFEFLIAYMQMRDALLQMPLRIIQ